ncbi:MAG: lactococcin 972 family bacteriocin [Streptococcaceae bacterium]|jgi:lactococcin 972 family bacteriocin|nr:lactococcin 972 family bacteriocin [Streptococcaceae bacterium]
MSIKKIAAGAAVALTLAGGVSAAADIVAKSGGTWDYGYSLGNAHSNYIHPQRYHGSEVVDRNNGNNFQRVNARAGAWSKASITLPLIGGQASLYYNTSGY